MRHTGTTKHLNKHPLYFTKYNLSVTLTFVNSVIVTINNSLKTQFCHFFKDRRVNRCCSLQPGQKSMQFVQLGEKKWIFHKSHEVRKFTFFPSHPTGLPLFTRSGLRIRRPSCLFFFFKQSRTLWSPPRQPGQNSRDEKGVSDWGRGDCRSQGHSLGGRGIGFGACTRQVCVQRCLEMEDKEGLRKNRNKARLVLIKSVGHNPS